MTILTTLSTSYEYCRLGRPIKADNELPLHGLLILAIRLRRLNPSRNFLARHFSNILTHHVAGFLPGGFPIVGSIVGEAPPQTTSARSWQSVTLSLCHSATLPLYHLPTLPSFRPRSSSLAPHTSLPGPCKRLDGAMPLFSAHSPGPAQARRSLPVTDPLLIRPLFTRRRECLLRWLPRSTGTERTELTIC